MTVRANGPRLGKRGTVLFCIGLIWTLFGFSIYIVPTERFSRPGPSPLDFLDSPNWSIMWIAGGAVAVAGAWLPRFRNSAVPYNCLIIPAFLWSAFFTWSALVYFATAGAYGEPRTWIGAIVWMSTVLMLITINGWEEPQSNDPI